MAEYKRFVSYMYEYEDRIKKRNVGYVRVEIRNGECKFTINMRLQGLVDGIFPTYLIHRPSNDMDLLYLGDSTVKNQVMDSRLKVKENNISNSGYNFSEVGGVLLFLNSKVFYATEWDDKPIIMEEVLEALKPKKKSSPITSDQASRNDNIDMPGESDDKIYEKQAETYVADKGKANNISEAEDIGKATDIDKAEDIGKAADIGKAIDKRKAVDASIARDMEKAKDVYKASDGEKVSDISEKDSRPIYKLPGGWRASEAFRSARGKDPTNPWDLVEKYKQHEAKSRQSFNMANNNEAEMPRNMISADKIFANFPRIYPFEDNEISKCVKIEPKDIGTLPSDTRVLSNNSFLLHGYYCYHHLLFAEINDRYGSHYILGIPGIYHDRERFMARMFGFECFKPIRKRNLKHGDFGYWYIEVKFD